MLRIYAREAGHLVARDIDLTKEHPRDLPAEMPWIDLINPTPEEDRFVEHLASVSIPTREEMQEIEVSSRLYNEDGAEFMTMTALVRLDSDEPTTTPITFVLKGPTLVTVRYDEPRPFANVALRVQRDGLLPCANGEQMMFNLLEALIDRLADALERVGMKIETISREVFRTKKRAGTRSRDFQHVLEQIGAEGGLLSMVRESLVSLNRLLTYHSASYEADKKSNKEARVRLRTMQRDVASLSDHSSYLSAKIAFMLDATLGLINLEQNQIIKIFSIAAVCLMPPTLVASLYGMNFKHMPELDWVYGYPLALGAMVVTGILPFIYFRRKGWL